MSDTLPAVLKKAVKIQRGDAQLFIRIQAKRKTGELVDITPWTIWAAQWRSDYDDLDAVDLDVDVDYETSTITIDLTPEQSADMTGKGVFDIQATTHDGKPRTWLTGRTVQEKDVTR